MIHAKKNDAITDEFFRACQDGSADRVRELLDAGANPDCVDFFTGQRPLHVAITNRRADVVQILLADRRVSVDVADGAWRFPIDLARASRHPAILAGVAERLGISEAGVGTAASFTPPQAALPH